MGDSGSNENKDDVLHKAKDLVIKLYEYRDEYLLNNDIEKAIDKPNDVKEKAKEALCELSSLQLSISEKAIFFGLRGKILNISQDYDSRAAECLSKALKLNPNLIDAWNELGESYWKNKDIDAAYNCFTQANSKEKNKVSLRNLSMVQRQIGKDFESKIKNIKESVTTAKQAVSLDVTDGKSWFILGNAYLSCFFSTGQNPSDIKQAMVAYSRAEKDKCSQVNPDLHYNKAVAFKYEEDFPNAMKGYEMARKLDPEWDQPKEELADLKKRLKASVELTRNKAGLKPKRVQTLLNAFKDTDYGPYQTGVYTSPLNNKIELTRTKFEELNAGRNPNRAVCGKVVAMVPVRDSFPFPCILMDASSDCIVVSVFNLANGKGLLLGDTVAIPEPFVQNNAFSIENEELSFKSIRVDNPIVLVVNRRKVGPERLQYGQLSFINKSE